MFWFDKDMERVMLAKKKEVLAQIEDAKKRVLKELYCVKREVHTDFCEMLADYNRIDFALKKLVADLKQEVKECVDSYKNILAEQIVSFNQQIDTKINVFEQYVTESIATLENALAELEAMQNTVNGLITRVEELVNGCASAEDLEQLRQEFETAIANIDLSAFKEEILSQVKQSDWFIDDETDPAFIRNRTHYGSQILVDEFTTTTLGALTPVNTFNMTHSEIVYDLGEANTVSFDGYISGLYDGKEFSLPMRKTSLVVHFYKDATNPSETGTFSTFEIYDEVIVFGDSGTNNTQLTSDKQLFMYIYPPNNHLHLCIKVDASKAELDARTISFTNWKINPEKRLIPEYLGESNGAGKVLVSNGVRAEWVRMPLVTYSKVEVRKLYEGDLQPVVSNRMVTFTIPLDFEGFTVGETYYITMDNATLEVVCTTENKLVSSGSNVATYSNGTLTLKSDYVCLLRGLSENYSTSVHVELKMFNIKTFSNSLVLTSPNGTDYTIEVSDDGTLSATPVTT